MPSLDLPTFIARWQASTGSERSTAQSHFIDLCEILGQPHPVATDPEGASYAFERGVKKSGGGDGWADVWMRGHFAWEYKGKKKDLKAAYDQLLKYREDLESPPLLVVCDLNRFEVHTNFTDTVKQIYAFTLADLTSAEPTPTCALPPLDVLRSLFADPQRLRPGHTREQATEDAAAEFAKLASGLQSRGADPEQAAHFLMRLLFCLFAEDTALLPEGLFSRLLTGTRYRPNDFAMRLRLLFDAMATGGSFGVEDIARFNGGLFADDTVLDLTSDDLVILWNVAKLDWASIEPAIFGTLFERSLDPGKRSQLGAHYTSREDIALIVEPVLMQPLRKRWAAIQEEAQTLIARRDAEIAKREGPTGRFRAEYRPLRDLLLNFSAEIASVRVLDPACGSGNFLYVALKELLDLEKEVVTFAATNGLVSFFPQVTPQQLYGIEVNSYAHELASIVVWIGYIQWLRDNGFGQPTEPILKPLHNIWHRDAVLDFDADRKPVEPAWPDADVMIGNPPFLGGKRMRAELGDGYVDNLFKVYNGRVPHEADFVTYWFERARARIAAGETKRVGLLATNSIRGGANRRVLERIKERGDIFMAWSDRPWVLNGAAVRVSMIGFDNSGEQEHVLNGVPVQAINADLTGSFDLTAARRLAENMGIAFMGDTKGGAFDIYSEEAAKMLNAPVNPNGRPNSDVVKPWVNGMDIVRRPRRMSIIDFGVSTSEEDAALYELPYEYARNHVKPVREQSRSTRPEWWIHERPRPEMRSVLAPLHRFICTPRVSEHRIFAWLNKDVLPDSATIAIARDDDYFFGMLHAKAHEVWALRLGTALEDRPRYTPTTTFETFPFPWRPGEEPKDDPRVFAIADAARELVTKRDGWLNPPDISETERNRRTLTNLYNARPTWLNMTHRRLDAAVLDAYGWPHDLTDDQMLERLLALNAERAASGGAESSGGAK